MPSGDRRPLRGKRGGNAYRLSETRGNRGGGVVSRRMERAHVLVVDDEDDLRLVVRRLLESTGYRMTGAADAGRALEALHRDPPDLVLLDVGLPRVDGWRVLDRIRAASDVPVIMLTARSGELDRV